MKVSGGFGNLNNINNLFSTLHQGKVAMYANKLSGSKVLFPENKAPGTSGASGQGSLSSDAVGYVNDIKAAAGDLTAALKDLSGPAFNQNSSSTAANGAGTNEETTGGAAVNGAENGAAENTTATGGAAVNGAENNAATNTTATTGTTAANGEKTASRAISAVNDMVKSFNSLFSAAVGNTGDPKAQSLASRLMNVGSAYSKSLSDIGIGFDSSGKMTIDSAKLNKAEESGKLQQFFTENSGKNYGFTAQLGKLAGNVSNNTSMFVSNSIWGDGAGSSFSYNGFGNAQQMSNMRAGSIFDFSF
ncbi:MAG: hypothetical protein FWH17_00225 [Oscillospiraceae bacterium]|nr:hypothetical protein [Oscillospiraceae bacterium]